MKSLYNTPRHFDWNARTCFPRNSLTNDKKRLTVYTTEICSKDKFCVKKTILTYLVLTCITQGRKDKDVHILKNILKSANLRCSRIMSHLRKAVVKSAMNRIFVAII